MNWLDELDELLNSLTDDEFKRLWAKYDEFDCGPELEDFLDLSTIYHYIYTAQDKLRCDYSDVYNITNSKYDLAA